MRSRNASPGLATTRTISQSDRTSVPPVTELRSPPASRITGALSPVMALSFTEATPSMISPSAGMMSPASTRTTSSLRSDVAAHHGDRGSALGGGQALGLDLSARLAEGVGLRLAASLGHGLGEVREEHGEPQPDRDPEDEAGRRLALAHERLQPEQRGQDGAHVHHEHDGIADLAPGRELAERVDHRRPHDRAIEQRALLAVSHCWTPHLAIGSRSLRGDHGQVFDDRPQGQGGDEGQGPHEDHHADQQGGEQGSMRGQGPGTGRHDLLRGQ